MDEEYDVMVGTGMRECIECILNGLLSVDWLNVSSASIQIHLIL